MSLYGLILGISFVVGLEYFQTHEKLLDKNSKTIYQVLIIILGIIGARTYFVLFNLNYYLQNQKEILNTRAGGLGILGGLIVVIIYTLLFLRKRKINFIKFTDQFITILPLCQSIGRWGNYFNHEIYSSTGQPIWLYESILNLILFFILLKSKKFQTANYLIGFGFIRFFTEFFRNDVWVINNLKIGQIISIILILCGILIHYTTSHKRVK